MWHSTKLFSSIFDLGPQTPEIYSAKFALAQNPLLPWQRNLGEFGIFFDKIGYKSACMPDRLDMFGPTRGDDHGADLCCHGNDICARRGV